MAQQLSRHLQQQFINYWVVLNELSALEDSESGDAVYDAAYKAIEAGISKLPVATKTVSEQGMQYDVSAFELCGAEGVEVLDGKLAWVVSLHTQNRLETPITSAARDFVVSSFEEAARAHGGTARLAKVTVQSHFVVVEEEALSLEAV